MKNKKYLYWLGLLFVSIILFVTNPSEKEFKEYLKRDAETELKSQKTVEDTVSHAFTGAATRLAGLAAKRSEFYLFSIYEISIPGKKLRYIGILSSFLSLNIN